MEALPLADEVLQVPSTAVLHDDVDILLVPLERWRRQERGERRKWEREGQGREGTGKEVGEGGEE